MSASSVHMNPNIQVLREFDAETSQYLKDKLFGDNLEVRAKWEKVFQDPVFEHKFIMPLSELRQ